MVGWKGPGAIGAGVALIGWAVWACATASAPRVAQSGAAKTFRLLIVTILLPFQIDHGVAPLRHDRRQISLMKRIFIGEMIPRAARIGQRSSCCKARP